jgi:hypothetical protein
MSSHHSHPHDHHHGHSHHDQDHAGPHHHDHGHHDHQENKTEVRELSFEEKLIRMFEHWIKHNESHSQTYADWREKARANGMAGVAGLLDEIGQLNSRLTEKLKDGLNKAQEK